MKKYCGHETDTAFNLISKKHENCHRHIRSAWNEKIHARTHILHITRTRNINFGSWICTIKEPLQISVLNSHFIYAHFQLNEYQINLCSWSKRQQSNEIERNRGRVREIESEKKTSRTDKGKENIIKKKQQQKTKIIITTTEQNQCIKSVT